MDKRITKLSETKSKFESLSKKLQWAFFTIFIIYFLIAAIIVVSSIFSFAELNYVGPNSFLHFVPIIFNTVAGGASLLLLGLMFRSIGKGASPFSSSFVKALNVLGILFLVAFISGFFIDPGTTVGFESSSVTMEIDYDKHSEDMANVDLSSLLTAVACFALAAVFRYAGVLQTEVNDLL